MLEISHIRENRDATVASLLKRSKPEYEALVDRAIEIDKNRRTVQGELDALLADQNALAKEVGKLMQGGDKSSADAIKATVAQLKDQSHKLKEAQNAAEHELTQTLYQIPNAPAAWVMAGKTPEENEEVFAHGTVPALYPGAKPHWDLAAQYKLIDFEAGVKITGAGFPVYTGAGAKVQRALINFFLDEAENAGYHEVMPPLLVNEESGYGTGQLPDKEGQMYHATVDNFYLIPTAEVPITNIYRDTLVAEEELPLKLCGYTPCFRREAGSYGKDVRGLNRLHQFDKVEIVQIAHPDHSYALLDEMVDHVKGLLTKLELPYRILRLCGGDMGFASAMTYDFEVYSAAQQKWLEVSSVSNFETYQSNRLKCRFRTKEKKTQLVHTLNGSALALPRIVASLLENHQYESGIRIPAALHPYLKFTEIN